MLQFIVSLKLATPRQFAHLPKCNLTGISNHGQGRNRLFLYVSFYVGTLTSGIQELEKAFDDGIEVREKGVPLDAFTKVDEGGGGV